MKRTVVLLIFSILMCSFQLTYCQSDTVNNSQQSEVRQSVAMRRGGKVAKIDTNIVDNKPIIKDTNAKKVHVHNPKLATCLSIIPGGGQIYNHKAWKIPIIYGLLCGASYFVYDFGTKTKLLRDEYVYRMNGNTELLDPELAQYKDDNILGMRNEYRTYLEISVAALAVVYLLNIIDACVDAHLYNFDISDDLSMQIMPSVKRYAFSSSPVTGLSFTFNLK